MPNPRKIIVALCLFSFCYATASGQKCGKERWSVKTGTDSDAAQVQLSNTQSANISDLIVLPAPNPIPSTSRFAPTEDTVLNIESTLFPYCSPICIKPVSKNVLRKNR